jgi:hypothetical protein
VDFEILGTRQKITNIAEWLAFAGPAGKEKQWQDGHSAKELAKAWTRDNCVAPPNELTRLLENSDHTRNLTFEKAFAEEPVLFDNHAHPRKQDLEVFCRTQSGNGVVLSIEAKSTEKFDEILSKCYQSGFKKKGESKIPARIRGLLQRVFGAQIATDAYELPKNYQDIRYQLLYSLAGAVAAAQRHNATLAVFLVHEFVTEEQSRIEAVKNNWNDYIRFAKLFKDQMQNVNIDELGHNHLIGPFHFAERENPKFLIGHLRTIIK